MDTFLKAKDPAPEKNLTFENGTGVTGSLPVRRVVLVTGGTRGIGSAISRKMASLGHLVGVSYDDEEQAHGWHDRIKKEGYSFFLYHCNMESLARCQKLIRDVARDMGPIQILANAAGVACDLKPAVKVAASALDSAFNVTCSAMDGMLNSGFGRIINISHLNGHQGQFLRAEDAAGRGGLHEFTRALAREVSRKGITVNTISPEYAGTVPVGRFGRSEDAVDVAAFLASDESGSVTGANIAVRGGYYTE